MANKNHEEERIFSFNFLSHPLFGFGGWSKIEITSDVELRITTRYTEILQAVDENDPVIAGYISNGNGLVGRWKPWILTNEGMGLKHQETSTAEVQTKRVIIHKEQANQRK